jgi:Short C-terminal domain
VGVFKRLFGREEAQWSTTEQTPPGVPPVVYTAQPVVLTGDEARQALKGIETATGMDLDGDGLVGDTGAPPREPVFTPASPDTDVVTQLERLAALRDSGSLTPEEFSRQKAKLLGGP